jgi:hypothetical protein
MIVGVVGAGGREIGSDIDGAGNTATLKPSSALAVGASYTARLTTGVRSAAGAPLADPSRAAPRGGTA